jgi:phosphatidylserine/phosphatidylglycerophosphate/cardiolipin synthase-like enzyme
VPARTDRLLALACLLALLASGPVMASRSIPATGEIEIAFSPADDPERTIIRVIDEARASLLVHAYVFTSRNIARAMIAAQQRGVRVEVLADARMHAREEGNVIASLLAADIPVAFETAYAAAHNKVIVADADGPGCAVVTGSYNFTWSARNRNSENVLVLRGNCELAGIYRTNWLRHREQATVVRQLPFAGER